MYNEQGCYTTVTGNMKNGVITVITNIACEAEWIFCL